MLDPKFTVGKGLAAAPVRRIVFCRVRKSGERAVYSLTEMMVCWQPGRDPASDAIWQALTEQAIDGWQEYASR